MYLFIFCRAIPSPSKYNQQINSRCKCQYVGCEITKYMIEFKKELQVRRHGFNIQSKEITEQWLRNSGAEHLSHLNKAELKRYFICSRHFKTSSYCKGNRSRLLLLDAVPVPHEGTQGPVGDGDGPPKCLAVNSKMICNVNKESIENK